MGTLYQDTRLAAENLKSLYRQIYSVIPKEGDRPLTSQEISSISQLKQSFDESFDREHRNLSVFTVLPKGIFDTRMLVEKAEMKFGEDTRKVFTDRVVHDIRQAGKCLAFELSTAMAFHVMLATESLIKDYYSILAKQPWPHTQRDWGRYITEIEKLPDHSPAIITRLKEIHKMDRNPVIHPQVIVSLKEAPIIFDLCNGVIFFMAEEILKRKPLP